MGAAVKNCPHDILKTLLGFFSLPQHISNLLHILLLYYLNVIMIEILIAASVWDIEEVKVRITFLYRTIAHPVSDPQSEWY